MGSARAPPKDMKSMFAMISFSKEIFLNGY
jgi:hypothetical protein